MSSASTSLSQRLRDSSASAHAQSDTYVRVSDLCGDAMERVASERGEGCDTAVLATAGHLLCQQTTLLRSLKCLLCAEKRSTRLHRQEALRGATFSVLLGVPDD